MVFRQETLRKKKKSSGRKAHPNLSKMPRTGKIEQRFYNTTNIVTKCNYMTGRIGRKQQEKTENLLLDAMKNTIIICDKMRYNIES